MLVVSMVVVLLVVSAAVSAAVWVRALFWVLIIGGGLSWDFSLGRACDACDADAWSTIMERLAGPVAGTGTASTVMGDTNPSALFLTSLVGLLWTITSKLDPDRDRRREERVAASLVLVRRARAGLLRGEAFL